MLKRYSQPFSRFGRRVRIALEEKSISCEEVFVDMGARKHREPEYRALNPHGRVPTLVDGDLVLFESTAILNYLEACHPRLPLVRGVLGADGSDAAAASRAVERADLVAAERTTDRQREITVGEGWVRANGT